MAPVIAALPSIAQPMIWIYRLLSPLAFLVLLPHFVRRMHRRGGYKGSTAQRLGWNLPPVPRPIACRRVWVQAVSVGELSAIEPLIRELARDGEFEFVLTTTTSTGHALARQRLADVCRWIGWFPLDFAPCSRRVWNHLRPDAVLLVDSELWPEHLRQATGRGVPIFLINARLSDRSFRRYQRVAAAARPLLLDPLSLILAATSQDAERWRAVAPLTRVMHTGNLKFDLPVVDSAALESDRVSLHREFGFSDGSPGQPPPLVIFGNSTWPGEETMLIDAWQQATDRGIDCRVVLVPRHAERREEIRALLRKRQIAHHFRGTMRAAPAGTQVYIADTTGELLRLLRAASVVFVGKSLPPHAGGQNPLEAISLGLPVVFGPRMSNFRQIAAGLVQAGAARSGGDAAGCIAALLELLSEPSPRTTSAAAAAGWLERHRGAVKRAAAALRADLHDFRSDASRRRVFELQLRRQPGRHRADRSS